MGKGRKGEKRGDEALSVGLYRGGLSLLYIYICIKWGSQYTETHILFQTLLRFFSSDYLTCSYLKVQKIIWRNCKVLFVTISLPFLYYSQPSFFIFLSLFISHTIHSMYQTQSQKQFGITLSRSIIIIFFSLHHPVFIRLSHQAQSPPPSPSSPFQYLNIPPTEIRQRCAVESVSVLASYSGGQLSLPSLSTGAYIPEKNTGDKSRKSFIVSFRVYFFSSQILYIYMCVYIKRKEFHGLSKCRNYG